MGKPLSQIKLRDNKEKNTIDLIESFDNVKTTEK